MVYNDEMKKRVLVWFSCGAASAVAAYFALKKYPKEQVEVIYMDTSEDEHPDNLRFLKDVENWLGIKVKFLKSDKFENVDDVIKQTKFLVSAKHAPCTLKLKIDVRLKYQKPGDIHVLGYTADELNRMVSFEEHNPKVIVDWVLEDENITKDDCFYIIQKAGIKQNQMYLDGFPNANCIGCLKAANLSYWGLIKNKYPEIYEKRAKQERMVGYTINKDQRKGKDRQLFLDEMTEADYQRGQPLGDYKFSCGGFCEIPEKQGGLF